MLSSSGSWESRTIWLRPSDALYTYHSVRFAKDGVAGHNYTVGIRLAHVRVGSSMIDRAQITSEACRYTAVHQTTPATK